MPVAISFFWEPRSARPTTLKALHSLSGSTKPARACGPSPSFPTPRLLLLVLRSASLSSLRGSPQCGCSGLLPRLLTVPSVSAWHAPAAYAASLAVQQLCPALDNNFCQDWPASASSVNELLPDDRIPVPALPTIKQPWSPGSELPRREAFRAIFAPPSEGKLLMLPR